ncbi:MAG: hypothetical protein R3F11_03175 [Verrucomicrobiales bacterium]
MIFGQGGDDILRGGDGHDDIDGGSGADQIFGNAGDDTLRGGGGAGDLLDGGDGNDVIHGSDDGADTILGGEGADLIYGHGGNDDIDAGAGPDTVDGGDGDDVIDGEAGEDVLIGGAHHDTLRGHGGATPDDGAVDYLYGGEGGDQLFGGAGNDWLWGEEGDDLIDAGAGANNHIDFGSGEGAVAADFAPPSPTANPGEIGAVDPLIDSGSTLRDAPEVFARWQEFNGSATRGGASNSETLGIEPAIVLDAVGTIYLAWVDGRRGNYEIYVARFDESNGWQQLGSSAELGGVSDSATSSRRPALALDGTDLVLAWTEFTHDGSASDIRTAVWDGAAWGAPETVTSSGEADHAQLASATGGAVLTYFEASKVFAQQRSGSWGALGSAINSGALTAPDYTLAADGSALAVGWTDGGAVFVSEWGGASWGAAATVRSAADISGVSLAYLNGDLFAAWSERSDRTGGEVWTGSDQGSSWAPIGRASVEGGNAHSPELPAAAARSTWRGATIRSPAAPATASPSMPSAGTGPPSPKNCRATPAARASH